MDPIQETLNDIDVMTAQALKAQRPDDYQLLEYGRYMGLLMARDALIRNRSKATLGRLAAKDAELEAGYHAIKEKYNG